MTWALAGSAAVGVGSWALNKYAGPKNKGGGDGGGEFGMMIEVPPFWEDPNVAKTQDKLLGYGNDLLDGKPNEYYAPIGEMGGDMFQRMIDKIVRDTVISTESSAIKRGVGRGGPVASAVARNVGDISAKMNWADFMRALEGRAGLLSTGNNMVSGVRSAALNNQSQKNTYALNKTRLEMGLDAQAFDQAGQLGASEGGATAGIFDQVQSLADVLGPVISGNKGGSMTPSQVEDGVAGRGSAAGKTDWAGLLMEVAKTYSMFKK